MAAGNRLESRSDRHLLGIGKKVFYHYGRRDEVQRQSCWISDCNALSGGKPKFTVRRAPGGGVAVCDYFLTRHAIFDAIDTEARLTGVLSGATGQFFVRHPKDAVTSAQPKESLLVCKDAEDLVGYALRGDGQEAMAIKEEEACIACGDPESVRTVCGNAGDEVTLEAIGTCEVFENTVAQNRQAGQGCDPEFVRRLMIAFELAGIGSIGLKEGSDKVAAEAVCLRQDVEVTVLKMSEAMTCSNPERSVRCKEQRANEVVREAVGRGIAGCLSGGFDMGKTVRRARPHVPVKPRCEGEDDRTSKRAVGSGSIKLGPGRTWPETVQPVIFRSNPHGTVGRLNDATHLVIGKRWLFAKLPWTEGMQAGGLGADPEIVLRVFHDGQNRINAERRNRR